MNCIPSFHLLITSWQYSLTTPFWLSRTLCANQLQKITSYWQQAGLLKPKTTQNKWSHSQASACLTQSFCAVFFNISHEPNCSPTWCYYLVRIYTKHLFIISEDICTEHLILLVFALNISWGLPSLLFFCNDTNPYYSYIQLGNFLTSVELWVGVEHP